MLKGWDCMSLKSVELQVAIPKMQEASKMQEQMNRQGQQFQEKVAEKQLQEEVKKRGVTDEKDEQKRHNQSEEDSKQHAKQELMEKIQHPYIGNRIDFTR